MSSFRKKEIEKVVDKNLYGYTTLHPSFSKEYYDAVCGWFERRHHWKIAPEEILYVDGTITAIRHALLAFSNPDDGVLITRPVYTPFTKTILSTGRKVVNSPLKNNNGFYSINFEDFEKRQHYRPPNVLYYAIRIIQQVEYGRMKT